MTNKTCLIYNYAQHYREGIFCLLDKELDIDFYFGDKMGDVKKMKYYLLKNFKGELRNINLFSPIYWQRGSVSLFFKKYDNYVVLGEYYCVSTWILLLFTKVSKKNIYFWTHGWYGNESFIKRYVKKLFFNLADGVLLYGNYAKDLMIKEGFSDSKLHVIYNSLNYDFQLQVRELGLDSDIFLNFFENNNPVLIFTGRLNVGKKLEQIVHAAILLKERNIHVNLVFVGEGTEEVRLKMEMDFLGFSSYWFYGSCYDENKLGELIYNSSICVSPGNVGLTALHSLVYGTPVITHSDFPFQMPEFEAIQLGVSGDFFTKNDENDLADVIEKWLLNSELREKIRANCFKIIDEKYNPYFQTEVIKSVLRK